MQMVAAEADRRRRRSRRARRGWRRSRPRRVSPVAVTSPPRVSPETSIAPAMRTLPGRVRTTEPCRRRRCPRSARMTPVVLMTLSSVSVASAGAHQHLAFADVDGAAVRYGRVTGWIAGDDDPHQPVAGRGRWWRDCPTPGRRCPCWRRSCRRFRPFHRRAPRGPPRLMVISPWLATRRAGLLSAGDVDGAVGVEARGVDGLAGGDQAADIDFGGAGEDDAGGVLDDHGARARGSRPRSGCR